MEFSRRSQYQILKGQTDKQVSKKAAKILAQELEEYAREIAEDAVSHATEQGRSTIKKQDIKYAKRQYSQD